MQQLYNLFPGRKTECILLHLKKEEGEEEEEEKKKRNTF